MGKVTVQTKLLFVLLNRCNLYFEAKADYVTSMICTEWLLNPFIFQILLSRQLAFFQKFFSGRGQIYCYANFSIVSNQISGGSEVSEGGANSLLPPVEESQNTYIIK